MTMRWTDGFYTAETAANLALKYDYVNTVNNSPSYARTTIGTNSYGANIPAATGSYIVKSLKSVITSATTPMIVGFRYKLPATGAANGRNFFGVRNQVWSDANGYDATGQFNAVTKQLQGAFYLELASVSGSTAGFLLRRRDLGGNTPTTLYTSATTVLSTSTFCYIEIAAYGNTNTTGRVVLRINGTQVYDSGATISWNTGGTAGPVNEILPYGIYDGVNASANVAGGVYADMYACDDTGTTNNNFLGDTTIETVLPSSDGTLQQFTTPAPNLLTTNQYGFEAGTVVGWAADTANYASSTTPTATTAQAFQGTYSLTFAQNFASSGITTPNGTSGLPVTGATTYTFAARGLQTQSNNPQFGMAIDWYDSSGTFISTSVVSTTAPPSGSGWTAIGGSAASPSNAAYAALRVYLVGGSPVNTALWLDTITFYLGNVRDASSKPIYQPPSGHYTLVNETSPDSTDSSYVRSGTSGQVEAYKYTLASASGLVAAVNFAPILKREALGSNTLLPYSRTRGIPTYVQSAEGHASNASSFTITLGAPTQAGDCVVLMRYSAFAWTPGAVTGLGATWALGNGGAILTQGGASVSWSIGYNCSAGQTVITVPGASSSNGAVAFVFRGIKSSATPVISEASFYGQPPFSVTLTPTAPNQLMVLAMGTYSNQVAAVTGGSSSFAVIPTLGYATGQDYEAAAYAVATSTAAQTLSGTMGNFYTLGFGILLDAALADVAGTSSVSAPVDTNYHQATGIVEANLAATSRPLTIAEFNAAEFGLQVP